MKNLLIASFVLASSVIAFASDTHIDLPDVPCETVPEPSAYVAWSIIGVVGAILYWRNRKN